MLYTLIPRDIVGNAEGEWLKALYHILHSQVHHYPAPDMWRTMMIHPIRADPWRLPADPDRHKVSGCTRRYRQQWCHPHLVIVISQDAANEGW
ncbi:MAG: hypothetical protein KatS3mg054_0563 [Chloroflexus sp.]|nr:MAG: hypothetical protein KatS3mg054_0563 [Chloroflexus sp.]GIV91716.1 MAG: hypothetical protein KatS3mg056_0425 [Chloroflexus sp.]